MEKFWEKWKALVVILAVVVLLPYTQAKPQFDAAPASGPLTPGVGDIPPSPWSQWMALKAPPIPGILLGGGGKAKKKLVPGPPPPEGIPESPWLAWTRMKVSPPVMPAPISAYINPTPAPPMPVAGDPTQDDSSTPDEGPSVWIQWAQLQLPLTDLLLSSLNLSAAQGPTINKRMAPDRYESTVAPRLWPPPPPRPVYPNYSIPPQLNQLIARQPAAPISILPYLGYSHVAPAPQQTLAEVLRPLPHQIVSQVTSKGTPEELVQTILSVAKAEATQIPVQVNQLLPATFVSKLEDDLTPLLTSVVQPIITPAAPLPSTPPEALKMIPAAARKAIVSVATPLELNDVIGRLSKLEAVPAPDQAVIATLPVSAILPTPLAARTLPSAAASLLIPPKLLQLPVDLPQTIVSVATSPEITTVIENLAKLEKIPSVAPRPPVRALLPATLLAKMPPKLLPVLSKLLPSITSAPPPPPMKLTILPEPLATILPTAATPNEITTVEVAVSLLSDAATVPGFVPPPVGSVIPVPVVSKLPPQLKPVLNQPLILPSAPVDAGVASVLAEIPLPVLQKLVAIASPEELAELNDNVLAGVAAAPVTTPMMSLLPSSLLAKLPPPAIPVLGSKLISIKPPVVNPIVTKALANIPPPVIEGILKTATPPEIAEITTLIEKLSQLPAEVKSTLPEVQIESILPATLIAKLSPTVVPLLSAPVVVPAAPLLDTPPAPSPDTPSAPAVSKVAPALAALPGPLATEIVAVATPPELEELATILEKLATVPAPFLDTLQLSKVLPPSLVTKLPPPLLPLLTTIPAKVLLAPPPQLEVVKASLINLPPQVTEFVLAAATPTELEAIKETLDKVEAAPGVPTPRVLDVVPPSLVSKLGPGVVPLLTAPVAPPVKLVSPPASILDKITPALANLPAPLAAQLMAVATPPELDELVKALSQLESVPMPILEKLTAAEVLPPSVVTKLPPAALPLLATTPAKVLLAQVPSPPALAPVESVKAALVNVPPEVASILLATATPAELAEIKEKLETIEPIVRAPVPTVLDIVPAEVLAKLPPTVIPALKVPVSLPPTAALPQDVIIPALAKVPPPVVSGLLTIATPEELETLAETIVKLTELPAVEAPLVQKLEVDTILPKTLLEKVPAAVLPELAAPVALDKVVLPPSKLPTTVNPEVPVASPPTISVLPPTTELVIVPALAKVTPPVVTRLLAVATPEELAALTETILKLKELPVEEAPVVAQLEVETILPKTLLAKVPPTVLPALAVPIDLEKVIIPEVPPATESPITPMLSKVPPALLQKILAIATPEEVKTLTDSLVELEKIPEPDLSKITVASALPPSLTAKIPPTVVPRLEVPLETPLPPKEIPLSLVLAKVPPEVVSLILSEATADELKSLEDVVSKLETAAPADIPILETLEVASILPDTLVKKLPPTVIPELAVPLTIPGVVPPAEITSVISIALAAVSPTVLMNILTVATPPELAEVATTIKKLDTAAPLKINLNVATILPPTLTAKLPPAALPLLEVPLAPIPAFLVPEFEPPAIAPPAMVPVATMLTNVPAPVASLIFSVATPEELESLEEILVKLEALPSEEVALVEKLEVDTILPPSLIAKLPPRVLPLLDVPIGPVSPTEVTPVPAVAPTLPPIPPVLANLPAPVAHLILTSATPVEHKTLEEVVAKFETAPPELAPALQKLEVQAILPPALVARLPPAVLPLLTVPIVVSPETAPSALAPIATSPLEITPLATLEIAGLPPSITSVVAPPLAALPPPVVKAILKTATPTELAEIVAELKKLEEAPVAPRTAPVVATILPGTLLQKLPPPVFPFLTKALVMPETVPSTTSSSVAPPAPVTELPPAEKAVLTKWAKVILDKTGKPGVPTKPEELPPLQAAWLEWVQLKTNKSTDVGPASEAPVGTTEYPWTQWLKLKNTSIPAPLPSPAPPMLDVATPSPEKDLLTWIEQLEDATTPPPAPGTPTEALVAEALKELGIEATDLPPEQLKAILEQVEMAIPPPASSVLPPSFPTIMYPSPPLWQFPPSSIPPATAVAPLAVPVSSELNPAFVIPSPTLNLTEYLISNSLLPPETPPTAPIPTSILSQLLTDKTLPPGSPPVSASDLSCLTPTKLAALLKQVLTDCKTNITTNTTITTRSIPNSYRDKRSPALYPIPSQAFTPSTSPSSLDLGSLPLPKVDTSDTVLDPAYWAAQKSMFLSKLFSTLANVALNDSSSTTPSPKDQLVKQVNSVLLTDMTRSIHHRQPKKHHHNKPRDYSNEDSSEDYDYQRDQPSDFSNREKNLARNDDSQPDLPNEPDNPLHKLFKFGVHKTVLSDQTTPETYPSEESPSSLANRLKAAYDQSQPKSPFRNSNRHYTQNHKKHRFRGGNPTTESPVDFEALAKALLVDGEAGNDEG